MALKDLLKFAHTTLGKHLDITQKTDKKKVENIFFHFIIISTKQRPSPSTE
jgi:hypothetical protein